MSPINDPNDPRCQKVDLVAAGEKNPAACLETESYYRMLMAPLVT